MAIGGKLKSIGKKYLLPLSLGLAGGTAVALLVQKFGGSLGGTLGPLVTWAPVLGAYAVGGPVGAIGYMITSTGVLAGLGGGGAGGGGATF